MICRNCNTYFPDNMSYCPRCKAPVANPQYNNVPQRAPQPATAGAPNNNNDDKIKISIAIIISVTVIVVALIAFAVVAFTSETKSNTEITKYQAMLQAYTSNPVVDVQELDYDSDKKTEAYIITGTEAVEGFDDGDIWFVDSHDTVHPVKHHVYGRPGTIVYTSNQRPYVTYEIYNTDRTVHNTYVYGVENSNYYEPPISGKYIDLHLDENNRLIGQSTSGGKYIQFDFNDAFEIVKSYIDENNKSTQPSTTKATPTTSKAVIEKTTKNQNNNGYLTASDSDFKDFKELADTIYAYRGVNSYKSESYNSYSSNAFEFAFPTTYNNAGNVFGYCCDKYGWSNASQHVEAVYENGTSSYKIPDPLHKLSSGQGYEIVNGEKLDWVLKNVFNVSPDHSMDSTKLKKATGNECDEYYYYNGNYYFSTYDYGWAPPTVSVTSKEQLSDGSYKIKVKVYDPETRRTGNYTFKTALRKVDGNKVWTIFSIE